MRETWICDVCNYACRALSALFLAVFAMTPAAAQGPMQKVVLHNFPGGPFYGSVPETGVVLDSAGNLYGTAAGGLRGKGIIYKKDTAGKETVLYSFLGGHDGTTPNAVILDSAGNLYGTTYSGGDANAGVVYKRDAAGIYTVLYSFSGGADGANPNAGVTLDSAGNLYGTTYQGGDADAGVLYKLDAAGNYTVLAHLHIRGRWGQSRRRRDSGLIR